MRKPKNTLGWTSNVRRIDRRDHISVVDILLTLGIIGFKRGKYAEAEKSFKEVLERRESKLGVDHPETAQALNDLGQLYIKNGQI